MIHITICDDEPVEVTYLTALTRRWAKERGVLTRLSGYGSAEGFLFDCGDRVDDIQSDILLLDIQMKAIDGLTLARRIRRHNERVQLIFITGYPDFIAEGYDVSALHYLLKPVDETKFFEVLDRAAVRLRQAPRIITFPKTGGDVKINADDILYAEVISHTVTLYLINGKEIFTMRISEMEALLGEGFIKCHRSYIVSIKHIRRVTKTAMVLNNGREIPLSRSLYDTANQAFIRNH
jgi:DNA-binding LytR/AlgR family response regulator